jgi:hypothetical protein
MQRTAPFLDAVTSAHTLLRLRTGCYIHQRCHNVLPRLAQICMFCALLLGIAPWALWKMFAALPPGFNGVAGVFAAAWAATSMLLVLDCIATPLAFMRKCVLGDVMMLADVACAVGGLTRCVAPQVPVGAVSVSERHFR